jgi:hypothetical protein
MSIVKCLSMEDGEDNDMYGCGVCTGAYAVYADNGSDLLFVIHDMRPHVAAADVRNLWALKDFLPSPTKAEAMRHPLVATSD